ncbi:hypothetical protein RvY_12326 [Ramazzottius varieornatus]|uniref:Tc1-like transposase DDE domain-containing protein n=1 Tax=Ramazzottius varieornatus TaxID=947166 RepID=A0A1D1VPJ5_RAMVA|nr:hypothetical protein RvY_12326 [Ramazzottius varieornatus]
MEEAMLPLDFENGKTDFVYVTKKSVEDGRVIPTAVKSPSFPAQRMVAAGYSYRGPTRLYAVPQKAKVNADLFIKKILKPMFDIDVPKFYGADAWKVILHMDSAPAHTAKKVISWLKSRGKYITKEEWLANSLDVSPMDFVANGYLKQRLAQRNYTTEKGMIRCAQEEYKKIPLEMLQKSLGS